MELWLVVQVPGGRLHHVSVEAEPGCPSGVLCTTLADHFAVNPTPLSLYCERLGAWLDDATTIAACGLRQGDRLLVDVAPTAERWVPGTTADPPTVTVVMRSNGAPSQPAALPAGEHVIGRGERCAIVVADPSVSQEHARLTISAGGASIADLGSTNGTVVNETRLASGQPTPVGPGDRVRIGSFELVVEVRAAALPVEARGGWVEFNRPPRVVQPYAPPRLRLTRPPAEAQRPRLPLIAAVAPLLIGMVLYLKLHSALYLTFALLSPIMAVGTYVEDRRHGSGRFKAEAAEFRRELDDTAAALGRARDAEAAVSRRASPGPGELVATARSAGRGVWERRPADADFVRLRIGLADRTSAITVECEPGGSDALAAEAAARLAGDDTLAHVPVTATLAHGGSIGLCGDGEQVVNLARWLAVQLAALHSPRDLVIVGAVAADHVDEWAWLKWLPHIRDPGSPIDGPHLAVGPAQARELLAEMAALRVARTGPATSPQSAAPFVAVLLDEAVDPDRAVVASILADSESSAIGAIWLGSDPSALPSDCRYIVRAAAGEVMVTDTHGGESIAAVTPDPLKPGSARAVGRALAPLRDASAAHARRGVPAALCLFELLDVGNPTAGWVAQRWAQPRIGLNAPVGLAPGGPFVVDLVGDGPHALIGGTTGSGKSELLQTLVISLACNHPPDRLTYLLVDYKGGAAFKDCTDLPHTVGFVTDLDADLAERALESLAAELRRREQVLSRAGAASLEALRRSHPDQTLPSLVIVIDEFATLAQELPAFVDGVVDIARRGRTLGLHLVLATQRPRGSINDNIRANTNLRIALRMVDAAESGDVLDATDAARIPRSRPGRAFARTGHGDLTEFQAGFAGAQSPAAGAENPVLVADLEFGRIAAPVVTGDTDAATDLERLAAAVLAANRELGLAPQPSPWLPPLSERIPLATLPPGDPGAMRAVVGLVDDPAHQRQTVLVHDFDAEGSLLVYGAGGAGKTTLLCTLAASLSDSMSPAGLQLYALDGGSGGLAGLAQLPHCGSVIDIDDASRVERLFALLRAEIERRRRLPEGAAGGGQPKFAVVLVLLDGYEGFRAAYERTNFGELVDALPRLVNDGRSLGVHFVITATRRGAVPGGLAGAIPRRVGLRMANSEEYAALGLSGRARRAELAPGRGYSPDDLAVQVAHAGAAPDRASQLTGLAELAAAAATRFGEVRAPEIRLLPDALERAALTELGPSDGVPIGVRESTLGTVGINLDDGNLLVIGPRRGGRTTALRTMAAGLAAAGTELWLFAPRRSELVGDDVWARQALGLEACAELAEELNRAVAGDAPPPRLVVMIDDGEELAEGAAASALAEVVRRSRDAPVRVVAAVERNAAHRTFTGWIRELRQDQRGVVLDPVVDVDGDLVGARLPRRASVTFPPGRAYLVLRGLVELIQVAR